MTEPKRDKILAMIAEGHSNEDIIAALGSSRKYVARLRWERNVKGSSPFPSQPTPRLVHAAHLKNWHGRYGNVKPVAGNWCWGC